MRSPAIKTQTVRWITIGKLKKTPPVFPIGLIKNAQHTIPSLKKNGSIESERKTSCFSDFEDQFFSSCIVKCRMMGASHLME